MGELRSFVVRVLGPAKKGNRVKGVVEVVDTGVRYPFASAAGLWSIVAGSKLPVRLGKDRMKKTPGIE